MTETTLLGRMASISRSACALSIPASTVADPPSLAASLQVHVTPEAQKCERERYKRLLRQAFVSARYTLVLDGIEFASEIVSAMDLYRAGRQEPSLQHFVDETRLALRQLPRRQP